MQVLFTEFRLNLIIECNANYLDITLNLLLDGTYKPYQKPEKKLHSQRIHSPSKYHQTNFNYNRNTNLKHSSNETVFRQQKILKSQSKKSDYNVKLQYKPTNQGTNNKMNRTRNIIWFNPSFSKTVSTKFGDYFLNLLDKHFPKNHTFHSIFNRNNVKVSYSCTENIKSIISDHNKTILNKSETLYKKNAPVLNIIYQSSLNSNKLNYDEKCYKGSCETTFKKRFANHKKN